VFPARAVDDLAFDELELPGETACLLWLADREERIGPETAALGSRLALEREHLRRHGAVVGKGVDAREAAPEELALDPEPVFPRELGEHAAVAVLPCAPEIHHHGPALDEIAEHRLRVAGEWPLREVRTPFRQLGRLNPSHAHDPAIGERQ